MGATTRMARQRGGKVSAGPKPVEFEGKGSHEMGEAKDKAGAFKRGGHAGGKKAKGRLDRKKRASGGRAKSPLSSAHALSTPGNGGGQGHEGEGPREKQLKN